MKRIVLMGTALVFLVLSRSITKAYRKEISHAYQSVADGSRLLVIEHGEIEYTPCGPEDQGSYTKQKSNLYRAKK